MLMNSLTYPRKYRLINKSEFKSVFNNAQKISQRHLLVLYKTNEHLYSRLGLVVAKRFVNKAVSRNRIKRVLRESFRHSFDKLKGLDIIIIARNQCDTLPKHKLRQGIDKLWKQLKT